MVPEDPANGPENPENGGEGDAAAVVADEEPSERLAAALQPPPLDQASEAYLRRAQLAEDRLAEVLGAYRQLKQENEGFRDRLTRNLERRFEQRHERLLLKFIEILDNLDRALEAAETTYTGDPMIQGLILVRTQLLQTLKDEGLERIPVLGLPFDPACSEAVATRPVQEREHHHLVVKDVLRGYRIQGRLARPARVVVGEYAGTPDAPVVVDEALLAAPTAEVRLPPEEPPPDAERIRRTPTVAFRLPPLPPPPPAHEPPAPAAAVGEAGAQVEVAEIIVPDEAPQPVVAPDELVEETADEPLPPIPPDLHGDPDLDAIIARAEGRLAEDEPSGQVPPARAPADPGPKAGD